MKRGGERQEKKAKRGEERDDSVTIAGREEKI